MSGPNEKSADGFAPRLGLFYAALGFAIGVQLPFLPLWLEARGLDARAIGIVLAAPFVVRVLSVPAIARAADRGDALLPVLIAACAAAAAGTVALGFAEGFAAIFAVFLLASLAFTAVMPLADAYALNGLTRRGLAYGPVRLWASAAFIAANVGAGLLLDVIAPGHLIWLLAAVLVAMAASAFALAPLPQRAPEEAPAAGTLALWRNRAFLAVIAAASLVQASHALYYSFSAVDWRAAGFDGLSVGVLWGLGVVAEIVLFALSGRLPPAFGPIVLLIVGAAGGTLRWAVMAFDPPAALLPALQLLHALSFGATHLGALGYLAQAAPARLGATAQGYLATVMGLVMAAATAMAGGLYGAYGNGGYAAMALMAAAGLGFALLARRLART
jgi:PPP family 3-phenylpropionic acid transporter